MNAHHVQITETQAEALREILFAFDELNRVDETPAEQTVFPVDVSVSEPMPPWVDKMYAMLINFVPKHDRAERGNDGREYSELHINPSDIAKLKGINRTNDEIRVAGENHDHPMVMMGTLKDNKFHVRVYDKARW